MAKGTRKPRQPRRLAVRFASRMTGRKKTLWQRRYRGSVKARNMTMKVRRPLKGTLRKKIRSRDGYSWAVQLELDPGSAGQKLLSLGSEPAEVAALRPREELAEEQWLLQDFTWPWTGH
ncbi:hypothetical protein R6Z07F_020238 [Ovis aries]